jgi:hypothetical protein
MRETLAAFIAVDVEDMEAVDTSDEPNIVVGPLKPALEFIDRWDTLTILIDVPLRKGGGLTVRVERDGVHVMRFIHQRFVEAVRHRSPPRQRLGRAGCAVPNPRLRAFPAAALERRYQSTRPYQWPGACRD